MNKELKFKSERAIERFFCLNDDDDDVLLMDLNEDMARNTVIAIAPGENKKPIPWLIYPNIDELTFPHLFNGEKFNLNNISYTKRVMSELRRVDRRSCVPDRLFYMTKRKQEQQCYENIKMCLRKVKETENITAGDCLKTDVVNELVKHDAGYRILANIRSSPAYWQTKKSEIFALFKQLGGPSLFLTITMNEKRSPELLQLLYKLQYHKDITLEEALNLDDHTKTDMIRKDPVTCARYFDHKVKKFAVHMMKEHGIFVEYRPKDAYKRIEDQMRGSLHQHELIWFENAPHLDMENLEKSEQECIEFIDKFITCKNDETIPFVAYQNHRHTSTCYKKKGKGKKCRFGYPLPIMKET